MSTRIRLRRMGANKRPFFRVVVADQRAPRDGRFIEVIGKYHPMADPSLIEIDEERALHWLRVGAQPSNQVLVLLRNSGIWDRFAAERPAALGQRGAPTDRSGKPDAPKRSKKAQAKAAEAAKAAAEPPAQAPTAEPAESEPTEAATPEELAEVATPEEPAEA